MLAFHNTPAGMPAAARASLTLLPAGTSSATELPLPETYLRTFPRGSTITCISKLPRSYRFRRAAPGTPRAEAATRRVHAVPFCIHRNRRTGAPFGYYTAHSQHSRPPPEHAPHSHGTSVLRYDAVQARRPGTFPYRPRRHHPGQDSYQHRLADWGQARRRTQPVEIDSRRETGGQ